MSSIVKAQPVNGVQNLNLGQYYKKSGVRNPALQLDALPSSESTLHSNVADSLEDISEPEERISIEDACRLAFEQGRAQGLKDTVDGFSNREAEIAQQRQFLLVEQDAISQQKEALSQLIAEVKSQSVAKLSDVESLAVTIAARAVKELVELGLVSQSGIVQLITGLVDKFRNESPVVEIRCGKFIADVMTESKVDIVKVVHDEQRGNYEFELRTQDAFYSVDVDLYVTSIFDAFSLKAPIQHD